MSAVFSIEDIFDWSVREERLVRAFSLDAERGEIRSGEAMQKHAVS
jgi:hypothetical protein